jgi:hypothetical protein
MKKLIAHRGNVDGCQPRWENNPEYIDDAIGAGYDVEIDIWRVGDVFYSGHDNPQYEYPLAHMIERKENLWIHAKNLDALDNLTQLQHNPLNVFWHQTDDFTITTHGFIWTYPHKNIMSSKQVVLLFDEHPRLGENIPHHGVCSDNLVNFKYTQFQ